VKDNGAVEGRYGVCIVNVKAGNCKMWSKCVWHVWGTWNMQGRKELYGEWANVCVNVHPGLTAQTAVIRSPKCT